MVSALASSAAVRGFLSRSGQTRDYKIDICCFFSANHAALWKQQRLIGSELVYCGRVEQHVYPQTVVSACMHNKDPTKRVDLIQSGHLHHRMHDIAENGSFGAKQ